MVYAHLEQQYEEHADPDAAAAAAIAREEQALMNQPPDASLLPSAVVHDLTTSHEAAVISVQCCYGEAAVITGSGAHGKLRIPTQEDDLSANRKLSGSL